MNRGLDCAQVLRPRSKMVRGACSLPDVVYNYSYSMHLTCYNCFLKPTYLIINYYQLSYQIWGAHLVLVLDVAAQLCLLPLWTANLVIPPVKITWGSLKIKDPQVTTVVSILSHSLLTWMIWGVSPIL